MKLVALTLLTILGLGATAHAEPDAPARPSGELRQLLLERFDRNHDGRLEPQERRRAIRALRRIARRMERQDRHPQLRDGRARGRADRFDANAGWNGDANAGWNGDASGDRDQP